MSIVSPTNRTEFKKNILAKLGDGVIKVNVSDLQVDIAVEEAIKWFWEWHHSGSTDVYYIVEPSEIDKTNRYITLPDEIFGVREVYSLRNQTLASGMNDLMSGGWDLAMNLAYSSSTDGSQLVTYVAQSQQYELLNQIINGYTALHYNYLDDNTLHIDCNWNTLGQTFAIEAYQKVNPDTNPKVWQDRWLSKYAVAKLKEIWGGNLTKYTGMQLPGGITFDGNRILQEGRDEISQIEKSIGEYSLAPRDLIG